MAITININTPDATININSSEDSGVAIPKEEPSNEKKPKNMCSNPLIAEATIKNIKCDHRDENGHFNVDCLGFPVGVCKCNICNELIDLKDPGDPHLVKKVAEYLWRVFQAMKANNTKEDMKELLNELGTSLYIIKEYMAKTFEDINNNLPSNIYAQSPNSSPFTPNMNDPFFHSSEFSRPFDSKGEEIPFPNLDINTPPKKDKNPSTKPKQQPQPSSK